MNGTFELVGQKCVTAFTNREGKAQIVNKEKSIFQGKSKFQKISSSKIKQNSLGNHLQMENREIDISPKPVESKGGGIPSTISSNSENSKKSKSIPFHQCVEKVRIILTNRPKEDFALIIGCIGVVYFCWGVFGIHFNLSVLMIFGSLGYFLHAKIQKAKQLGLINKVSPGLRKVLIRRSLFDLLCDLWYFPIIPKYFKAIFGPFIFKKAPEETLHNFDDLHPKFRQLFLTKGVINILPTNLKNFLLPEDILDIDTDQINEPDDDLQNNQGHSFNHGRGSYEVGELHKRMQEEKVVRKGQDNLRDSFASCSSTTSSSNCNSIPYLREKSNSSRGQCLNENSVNSTSLVICSQDVQNQIKKERLQHYLEGQLQNSYDKAEHYHLRQKNREVNSQFSKDPQIFLLKFLTGSKHVSDKDRRNLKRIFLAASIIFGIQLGFSKKSRQWLKYTLLFMLYLTTFSLGTGSLFLLAKHNKESKRVAKLSTQNIEQI